MNRLILSFLFVLFIVFTSSAQSSTSINEHQFDLLDLNNDNWSFYSDDNSQLFYIDFAKLTFNLSDIILKDSSGEIVFKDDVLDLPVDSIYELDLSNYAAGQYEVELRTFTGNLNKEVTIK